MKVLTFRRFLFDRIERLIEFAIDCVLMKLNVKANSTINNKTQRAATSICRIFMDFYTRKNITSKRLHCMC